MVGRNGHGENDEEEMAARDHRISRRWFFCADVLLTWIKTILI
jgi:hypothetical protein